jgi:hypothetical protein
MEGMEGWRGMEGMEGMEGKYVRGIFFGRRKKSLEGHSKEHLLYLKEYCKMVIGGSIYESRWLECQREQSGWLSTGTAGEVSMGGMGGF